MTKRGRGSAARWLIAAAAGCLAVGVALLWWGVSLATLYVPTCHYGEKEPAAKCRDPVYLMNGGCLGIVVSVPLGIAAALVRARSKRGPDGGR